MPIVGLPIASGSWGYALVDVDGVEHAMNPGDDILVTDGLVGLLMPPVDMRDRELPLRAGSQLQGVRIRTREGDVPIYIQGASLSGMVNRHEQLLTWVDPTPRRSDDPPRTVAWRVTRPDGTRRELICTYLGGFEGEEVPENGRQIWWRGVGTFRAHDPYWYDVSATQRTFTIDPLSGSWFPMTFPISLSGSQVFRTTAEDNTGSAETYPSFVITGPGTNPILRNLTTGTYLGLTLTLAAGEVVTVDMAPLVSRPIRDASGNSRYETQMAGSERWPLIRGSQQIQIEMMGASATSSVVMSYRRRWLRR